MATWSTILGTVLSFFGLIQSRAWLTVIGVLFAGVSIIAVVYARREGRALNAAAVKIEGRSIDSLNIANLRRRVNRSLVIQDAYHVAEIDREDLKITWKYAGYCRAGQETAMEFSIDADGNIPFDRLECFGYDLERDPGRKHPIRPILIGADGISKKIAVPLLAPVTFAQPFTVVLECVLPSCIKVGFGYYTSTLSFDQALVRRSTVRLIFAGDRPEWVRAYACSEAGCAELLKDLRPARQDAKATEYLDVAEDVAGQSARIYFFRRTSSC